MCTFIVWYQNEFSHQTSQFTSLVLKLCLVQFHLLWGEFSAFSVPIAIHNSPLFVPPGTHLCWVDRGGMVWKACPTPLHMAGSVTRALINHSSTNRAQCCLTSVIWRELVTTRPGATIFTFPWPSLYQRCIRTHNVVRKWGPTENNSSKDARQLDTTASIFECIKYLFPGTVLKYNFHPARVAEIAWM